MVDISIIRRLGWLIVKHEATYLDGKQCHTGFDYYEKNMSKFGTPGRAQSSLDRSCKNLICQEHLEDLEHDQARQGIHSNGPDRAKPVRITGNPQAASVK